MYFRIFFCPTQGQSLKPSAAHLYQDIGRVSPPKDKFHRKQSLGGGGRG